MSKGELPPRLRLLVFVAVIVIGGFSFAYSSTRSCYKQTALGQGAVDLGIKHSVHKSKESKVKRN